MSGEIGVFDGVIESNAGMDVTFFYGDKRIMTSAVDTNGDRILGSTAGEKIVEKVLKGGEEYFSHAVSIDGTLNYGYFMPVYQNDSDNQIIGMVFVGTDKHAKDDVINKIIGSIATAVVAEQIKNLSKQSNTSSKEIEATADMLSIDSAKAVQAMQQMQEIIASQSESMQETQKVVAEVIDEIASSMRSIAQIKESTGRLENARNEVLQSVEHLSDIAQDNLANTKNTYEQTEVVADTFKQVYNSADELKTIADELVKSIEYFKV